MAEISNKGFKKLVLAWLKCGISSEQIAKDLAISRQQMDEMLHATPPSHGRQTTLQLADVEKSVDT